MKELTKFMNKITTSHVVSIVAIGALGYALLQYANEKSMTMDGMNGAPVSGTSSSSSNRIKQFPELPRAQSCVDNVPVRGSGPSGAPEHLGEQPEYASAQGLGTSTHALPTSCKHNQVVDPKELMPKGDNEWSKLNPMGKGDLQGVNLLSAQNLEGIQTKGTSLRNANLQFRPDPVIPSVNTGPWYQSTITHDNRPGYEKNC